MASVCRVCLVGDIRLLNLGTIHLEAYEKLTNTKLITEHGMPSTICYICHRQLQRCHTFSEMARKSNRILQDLLNTGTKITLKTVVMQSLKVIQTLTVSPIKFVSISSDDYLNASSTPVTVKQEVMVVDDKEAEELVYEHHEKIDIEEVKVEPQLIKVESENDVKLMHMKTEQLLLVECDDDVKSKVNSNYSCFHCDVCNLQFNSKYLLVKHLELHNAEPYSCKTCNVKFIKKCFLIRHMQIHTTEKVNCCNKCDMIFYKKCNLTQHIMQIHTGKKPYSCNRCDKTFTVKYTLARHMLIHTGEKPFSCKTCLKTFAEKSTLKRHIRIHTGEKTYPCNRCDKVFYEKFNLTRHLRIHTGEKPFSCNICNKIFNEKGHLTRHIGIHTGEKPSFACNSCAKIFTEKGNLRKHIVNVHGKKK